MSFSPTRQDLIARTEARLQSVRNENEELWNRILADARIAGSITPVWASSEYVATSCERMPDLLVELVDGGNLFDSFTAEQFQTDIRERIQPADELQTMAQLRHFRRRHMIRIAWRDVA